MEMLFAEEDNGRGREVIRGWTCAAMEAMCVRVLSRDFRVKSVRRERMEKEYRGLVDMVAYHLLVKGFMSNYEDCRWAHGQRRDGGIAQVHNPGSSTHHMNDMVHDIAGPNFDWEQDREQVMNFNAKAFFKLLDEGSEPLRPGCTKQTTLSTVATLLNIKADHNMSHECLESLLKAIKSMLLDGEKLPDNYYFCKKMVKKLGLGYQKIDACLNDYHPFRRNIENFRKGKVENDMLAPRLSRTEMLDRMMRLPVIQFGKIAASEIINGFGDSHNWVRRSIFWELPYWSTNLIRHNLDVMHIEKNVFENVFSTVMGVPGKTKDNDKARLDMKDICKRPGLELYETPNGGKLQGMKSHDCHVFMERLMPIAFRDLLDKPIWDPLTDLSRFFRDICSKTLNEKDMSILEKNIIEITFQYRWMYPFETVMGNLKRKVKNRAYVEWSICVAYSFDEISMFISDYFPDEVLTKANRVPRHDDGGNVELNGWLSVFGLPGRAYGKGKSIFLSEQEPHAAHTYILFNYEEIDDFVRSYDDELKANQSGITDKDIQLSRDQNFALWLKDKALNDVLIPSNVQVLGMGPDRDQVCRNGYKVNGYDFHTKTYAHGKRTTNTGVCVQGDCYNELGRAFYRELEKIIELSYKGTYGGRINLFKCRWFDSKKGIRVDRHGIVDIDVHRKRDRPPVDWQVVTHTPARTCVQLVDGEFYQEEMLHRPPVINVDDNNELNQLVGGDEPDELDPKSVPVPVDSDTEEEELLTESDTDIESEEDDGYESPHDVQDYYESDNDFH
ncbi:hypothetical protein MRB53_014196 [Persea americana]|uniref:Uncharacterized protein n=1 Tax=Persea americana TaxID=3435 RepID=A0ACC2KA40_PERAE|nr:hypothetical protein MRB53_014196 [Persea americana]